MLTRSSNSQMDEVERIIQVLLVKDEQAVKNIGDPSVFMGVFDVDEEIKITSQAIESGTSAEDFASSLEPKQPEDDNFDFFALLDEPVEETRGQGVLKDTAPHKASTCGQALCLGERNLSPHSLRHTAGTLSLQNGSSLREVQDFLGHSDPKTTAVYTHVLNSQENNPADKIKIDF